MVVGSTETIEGVHTILNALEAIKTWIKGPYKSKMAEWFCCE